MCVRFNLGQRLRLTFPSRLRVTRAAEAGGDGKGKGRKTLSLSLSLSLSSFPSHLSRHWGNTKRGNWGLVRACFTNVISARLVSSAKQRRYPCFGPTTASTNYRSISNFRSTWLANRQWPFTRPVIACTQTLVHWWVAPTEKGFRHCFAEGLNRKISSVWVAGYLTDAL